MTNEVSYNYEGFEQFFNELYAPFKCVYFSRGRVALTNCIKLAKGERINQVFVQPYSSHCVLSAVSKVSTPLTIHPEESDFQIIYHSFGNKIIVDKKKYNNILIEDSVDSTIVTNNEDELFPNGGRFTIFSLSKIFRIPFGGIVVCHKQVDYDNLCQLRNESNKFTQTENLLITNTLFSDTVIDNQSKLTVSGWDYNKVKNEFYTVKEIIENNIEFVNKKLGLQVINNKERLPSNLIFENSSMVQKMYEEVLVEVKERHIYDYNAQKNKNVCLFPVHAGYDTNSLK